MANSRYYSSIAQQTTLTSGITASGTTMIVAATTGFPGSLPYTLAVDYGSATEELVEVTGVAGLTLTVTRAIDGTSGASHNPGAVVRHVSSARDFTDSRTHEAASTNVHGLSGGAAVVGTTSTQTLTNKTLTHVLGSADNLKLYNKGATGVTQIIGDSANPSVNRLEILSDESTLNILTSFNSTGAIKTIKLSGEADNVYKYRLTDNDGTTDRFAVLSGGTAIITPTSATTFVGLDIVAPDLTNTKRAIRVAASGGGSERFTVWNDGRVDIVGSSAANSQFDVTAAASQSADIMRVLDSGANTQFAVQSTGKMLANKGAIVAQPGVTSGAVLQVGGSNAGYTGNLQQWVGPGNSIVANINELGQFFAGQTTITGSASVSGALTSGVTTLTGTSLITAATNFNVGSASGRIRGQVATMVITLNYTGSTITADSAGNIADTLGGTLAAGWRPIDGPVIVAFDKSGVASGTITVGTDGTCTLKTLAPTATIASGATINFSVVHTL
jgi:hypothetical protein